MSHLYALLLAKLKTNDVLFKPKGIDKRSGQHLSYCHPTVETDI
jgi:hypothetical protein